MESANFFQHNHQLQVQQEQQQLVYSSSARVSTVNDQWNPSMALDGDEFNRYMNEILPNSRDYFWPKDINLVVDQHEDAKSCDFTRSYAHHPLPNKGNNISDCFLKLSDINGSTLKNITYIKNGQQDGLIDLNENLWIGSYSNGECFDRFVGVAPDHEPNLYASTSSFLPTSPNLRPSATEILNSRNCDEARTQYSYEERLMSSGGCHVQLQSSDSPSNSSNKTSTFRKEVSRTKNPKPTSSQQVAKKPRVAPHSSCPTLKVRKENLGDRIAALHRLVSPFGKTDTASVLTEAIGYIQFLQDQIQTLSMSYLKSSNSKSCRTTRGELFSMRDGNEYKQQQQQSMQDLRSKGLCLVPLAFTSYVCCTSNYNGSI
ncbi:hypothetical protein ACH5RR_013719 [Cinchona calisaya]|uniref:BHLH domain-containing protein n=1 Tax=Cinchona calisaya TaxID=153742 RepID=A0ABD3A4I1_9GENT